ncbi:MAG TPA: carboxypeptidase regulatory-like domain-containing protein [Gemmatimonadaceae bacterium]|nr:carboxypeptidase regulatory-like domain-containing protein [Gemmatimonadaceae bacterium]
MRSISLALLLGAMGSPLGAQTAKTGQSQIVGVVLDSINGGFLRNASILLEPARRSTESDSVGRFKFDSVPPGTYQLGVFHPVLDALDVSIATRPFQTAADSATVVILAVPSPATVLKGRCTNKTTGGGSSAIFGHVSDPETLQPVAGAEVSVAWTEIEISRSVGLRNTPHVVYDTTDTNGAYRLCGLPSSLAANLKARRGAAVTSEVPISLGSRPVEVQGRSLFLSKEDSTASTGNAAVSGVVLLEGNPPNSVSRVELEGTGVAVVTNEKGEFIMRNLPSGSHNLLARHIGYAVQVATVDLNSRETQHVTLKLPKYIAVMDPVLVTARRNVALDKVGFSMRKKGGTGYFLDADRISKMHPFYVSDILRTVPGLRVSSGSHGEQVVTSTRDLRSCVQYWVDDVPFIELEPGEANNFISGSEIVAAEVYQSGLAPAQYARAGASCTTIVLWTRFRIRG